MYAFAIKVVFLFKMLCLYSLALMHSKWPVPSLGEKKLASDIKTLVRLQVGMIGCYGNES